MYKQFSKSAIVVAMLLPCLVQAALPAALQQGLNVPVMENRISIEAPHLAENGSVVPINIKHINVPVSTHVSELALYSGNNTTCPIARYTLSASAVSDGLGTRIKLAKTTNIYAIAKLSDGRVLTGETKVKVTIGGCGGGGTLPDFSQMKYCKQ